MTNGPPPSRPPSDPKPLPSRRGADWTGVPSLHDPPVRLQMIALVLVAVVLIAIPLYLWRRPRSVAQPAGGDGGTEDGALVDGPYSSVEVDASGEPLLQLSDARMIECRDSASKRVPLEQCDPLPAFAKTLAESVLAARDCIPPGAGPGTVTYVADVAFSRRRTPVTLSLPKDGRSYRSTKTVAGCAAAVRAGVLGVPIDAIPHAHARYKIALVATYPAPDAGGLRNGYARGASP